MNRNLFISLLVATIGAIAFAACEEPDSRLPYYENDYTGRDPLGLYAETYNTTVNFTECKSKKDGDSLVSSVSYEYDTLFFSHENLHVNCAFDSISVEPEINGGTINVTITEYGEPEANCICPIDVNYTIDNIKEGHYNIVVTMANDTIYQTEIDCIEPHNTAVSHSECKSQQRNDASIVSSVWYENDTLFFTHENIYVNCAFDDVTVVPEINGQTITVVINEVVTEEADCLCAIDLNYNIDNIKDGTYNIIVKMGAVAIFQTQITCP